MQVLEENLYTIFSIQNLCLVATPSEGEGGGAFGAFLQLRNLSVKFPSGVERLCRFKFGSSPRAAVAASVCSACAALCPETRGATERLSATQDEGFLRSSVSGTDASSIFTLPEGFLLFTKTQVGPPPAQAAPASPGSLLAPPL